MIPVEENGTLLPSNTNSETAAENLKNEMLGKLNDQRIKKKRKIVTWKDEESQDDPRLKNFDIENIKIQVNEDIIVQPTQVNLPPRPGGNQVSKPNSLTECDLVCAISRLLASSSILEKPRQV